VETTCASAIYSLCGIVESCLLTKEAVAAVVAAGLGIFGAWLGARVGGRDARRAAIEAIEAQRAIDEGRADEQRRGEQMALVTELQQAELVVSSNVCKSAAHLAGELQIIPQVAQEFRWYLTVGRERGIAMGLPPVEPPRGGGLDKIPALPDETLVGLYAAVARAEVVGSKIITPIVDAVLAGRTPGFSADQLRVLSSVRWQAFLLEQEAEWMKTFYGMTVTTQGDNHDIAVVNLDNRAKAYARRSITLLRTIRNALAVLNDG